MSRLSNKGQTLAIFAIFIPVIIMIGTFVVDLGLAKYNDNELEEVTKMVLNYGLRHVDENPYDKMVDLLYQNDDSIDEYNIIVDAPNKKIKIMVTKATKGFFGSVVGKEIYKEKSSYTGYVSDGKIIMERDED